MFRSGVPSAKSSLSPLTRLILPSQKDLALLMLIAMAVKKPPLSFIAPRLAHTKDLLDFLSNTTPAPFQSGCPLFKPQYSPYQTNKTSGPKKYMNKLKKPALESN